jgi:heme oxygenase
MSFVQTLRAATAADHRQVDDRFGGFALDDPAAYVRFLRAHGRALPAVEAALAQAGVGAGAGMGAGAMLPPWRPRAPLIAADLAALGAPMPPPLPFTLDGAERWGALYVMEGSRLGGQLLARRVACGLPVAYLSAKHAAGAWRTLLAAIDAQAAAADAGRADAGRADAGWADAALAGARATFALYAQAADQEAMAIRSLPSRLAV